MSGDWPELTGPCFLSHSYDDEDTVRMLADRLRSLNVKPVVFELTDPNPSQPVSNEIVPTILRCESLIYLREGESARSFWVRFERDYALRSGRQVFAYDASTDSLQRDEGKPIALSVRTLFHRQDEKRAETLFRWMREDRHFDIGVHRSRLRLGSVSGGMLVNLEEILIDGGVLLGLCSHRLVGTLDFFYGPGFGDYLERSYDFRQRFVERRLEEIPALDDPEDLSILEEGDYLSAVDPFEYLFGVFAIIDPELQGEQSANRYSMLDLLSDETESGFDWNAADDLIISIFATIDQYRDRVLEDLDRC